MTRRSTEAELRAFLGELLHRNALALPSNVHAAEHMGLDSLTWLHVLVEVEDRFGITFADDELTELVTLRGLVRRVDNKVTEQASCGSA
ncbi:MAG: acyl carrier protein [Alphaproteobacteria bacterium]